MSDSSNPNGLDIRCSVAGCDREAAVRHKDRPLCAPHYQERIAGGLQRQPVRTRAGELDPGMNRHA